MNRTTLVNLATILVGLGCALFFIPGMTSDTDPNKNVMWNLQPLRKHMEGDRL